MDLLATLETMAENAAASPTSSFLSHPSSARSSESTCTSQTSSSSPHHGQIERWARLFHLSSASAEHAIKAHYADLARLRISDQHWEFVREEVEPQGHDRESYAYYLMRHNARGFGSGVGLQRKNNKPAANAPGTGPRYIFKLMPPLDSIEKIASNLNSTPSSLKLHTDESNPKTLFVEIDSLARSLIETYLQKASESSTVTQPIFATLRAPAPKNIHAHSLAPHLGHSTTLPQFRLKTATSVPRPAQDEYPVPYFFYGTLGAPDKLSSLLNLDVQPVLHPAVVRGGRVKSWGRYRALVDGEEDKAEEVVGWLYEVQNREQEDVLRWYEGAAYEVVRCDIWKVDGGEGAGGCGRVVKGLTIRFRGA